MTSKDTPPSEPTARSSKSALLEAAHQAIAERESRPVPGPAPASSRVALRGFLIAVLVAAGAVLLARPAWLISPPLPTESPANKAATATMALVELMNRLQAYQAANGRLPATLQEVAGADSAITYRPGVGGDFELSLRAGDSVVSIRATDSLKARVVDAIRTLQARSSP